MTPVKVLDTRDGTGGVSGPLGAGATATFAVTGVGAVPQAGVADVFVVITAIGTAKGGCLDDYSADVADPGICAVSFDQGDNVTDSDIVAVSSGGDISVTDTSGGSADVVVTVMGYYASQLTQTAGDTYVSLPAATIVDTRTGLGGPQAQIPAGGTLTVQVAGQGGVPAGAVGAALYVGAANASHAGWVSAYPAGASSNALAMLNYVPGQVVRDLYFGALSASGQLTLRNDGSQPVDLMAGVQGYLAGPAASPARHHIRGRARAADRRHPQRHRRRPGPDPSERVGHLHRHRHRHCPLHRGRRHRGERAGDERHRQRVPDHLPGPAPGPQLPGCQLLRRRQPGQRPDRRLVSAVDATGQQTITNHSSAPIDLIVTLPRLLRGAHGPGRALRIR